MIAGGTETRNLLKSGCEREVNERVMLSVSLRRRGQAHVDVDSSFFECWVGNSFEIKASGMIRIV